MRAWLSKGGTASAAMVGGAVWLGAGWRGLLLLFLFLATSSMMTPGGGRRSSRQVFANGGVAALCALLARWYPTMLLAFAGALAAATADTWSTEIGRRSPSPPRLITTWRQVETGTSGGVSVLGSAAALTAAVFIASAALLLLDVGRLGAACVALSGVAGSLADSFLGATLQARWRCPACGALIETPRHGCGAEAVRAGGIRWLDNDAVNFLATLVGALPALLAAILGIGSVA